jgi:hypothetical protein
MPQVAKPLFKPQSHQKKEKKKVSLGEYPQPPFRPRHASEI